MRMPRLTIMLLTLVGLGALGVAPAAAAPVLNLDIHHNPTHFAPGGVPGSLGVKTVSDGSATVNEVQEIRVAAEEGQFRLSFKGETTTDLPFDATGVQVRNALEALPKIGLGNLKGEVDVEGSTRTYKITFKEGGLLAHTDVPQIVAENGTSPLKLHPEQYSLDVWNVGDANTSGTVTVTVQLPAGLSRGASAGGLYKLPISLGGANVLWSCPGSPGDTTVTCTSPGPIPRHSVNDALTIAVAVDPGASGEVVASASASGGSAANVATAQESTEISSAPDSFGILADSFVPDFFHSDGLTPVRRSGEHPDLLTVPFDLTSTISPVNGSLIPAGNIRDLVIDFPPGFLGSPTAVGECSQAVFTIGDCPGSTQVGRIDARVTGSAATPIHIGVFNLLHPRGAAADIAIAVVGNPVHVKVRLDPANRYAVTTKTADLNETLPPLHQKATIWGAPAAHSHDSERCASFKVNSPISGKDNGETSKECSTDHELKAFLTVPSECGVEHQVRLREYDSWQNTGAFGPEIDYTQPGPTTDCDVPRFEPEVALTPTGHQANTPTGLDVHVQVPQNENPNGLATPPVKSTVVTLPEGMVFSPSFADGLEGCSLAQIGLETNDPVACPDASRIGEVRITSPALPKALEGSMYFAKQGENPFGSLFAIYMAVHDTEERGVLVKLAGEISLDPATGQITQTFEDLPQFPVSDFTLQFRSGERAPLVNPPTCGEHTIAVEVTSYAQPNDPVDASNTYQVSEGPGGAPCAANEAARPFDPKLLGGTLNPVAGVFSPMTLRVSRSDADQEITTVQGTAPKGLTASLRGVSLCPESKIALARSRSAPGQGALEQASPSCPASSQVGVVQTGAGAGPSPIYIPGKAYLAGPYKGAPLSGVAVVPAIAGPVDLGTIVVRAPAFVDPKTAQVRIASDRLPQIVHGVLVRVRDIRLSLNRPRFTLNPTGCEPKSLDATLKSVTGALASLSNRFQVGDCASLGFKPSLTLKLRGGTGRGAHPALRSVYQPRPDDANLEGLVVRLPRSAFLDQAHIRTICTRVQFAANNCPEGAIYGHVRAFTPLLDQPLEGPAYLRSSNHNLPDLVFDLHGLVDFEASARIDSKRGGIRATFIEVPDAPIDKVVVNMQGGGKGLIVNSTNLCAGKHRANVKLSAHNGRQLTLKPLMRASCGGKKRG
jgi:hypothetical protein